MANNASQEIAYNISEPGLMIQVACIIPEYINILFLLIGLYGMYQGIEIVHPLYAILFLNLVVASLTSILNMVAFPILPIKQYFPLSNFMNTLSLYFQCTSWCLTSLLRYIYILHDDWISNLDLGPKSQCCYVILCAILMTFLQLLPPFLIALWNGKLKLISF